MMQGIQIAVEIALLILGLAWLYSNHSSKYNNDNIVNLLIDIFSQLNQIQMDQQALAAELTALKEQGEKSKAEITGKIATLEEAIANGGPVSQEVQDALASLKATVQGIDDIVPDAPVNEEGTGEQTEV